MKDQHGTATRADVAAALVLLERLGVRPEQLLSGTAPRAPVPTFDEYIDRVSGVVTDGTSRVYATYWRRVREAWGPRP